MKAAVAFSICSLTFTAVFLAFSHNGGNNESIHQYRETTDSTNYAPPSIVHRLVQANSCGPVPQEISRPGVWITKSMETLDARYISHHLCDPNSGGACRTIYATSDNESTDPQWTLDIPMCILERKRRFLFVGPSHARNLYCAVCELLVKLPSFAHNVCPDERYPLAQMTFSLTDSSGATVVTFVWKFVGERIMDGELLAPHNYTNVVFVRGAWDAVFLGTPPHNFAQQNIQSLALLSQQFPRALVTLYLSHYFHGRKLDRNFEDVCCRLYRQEMYREGLYCAAANANAIFKTNVDVFDPFRMTNTTFAKVRTDWQGYHYSGAALNGIVAALLTPMCTNPPIRFPIPHIAQIASFVGDTRFENLPQCACYTTGKKWCEKDENIRAMKSKGKSAKHKGLASMPLNLAK
jgi:hypothetical protein